MSIDMPMEIWAGFDDCGYLIVSEKVWDDFNVKCQTKYTRTDRRREMTKDKRKAAMEDLSNGNWKSKLTDLKPETLLTIREALSTQPDAGVLVNGLKDIANSGGVSRNGDHCAQYARHILAQYKGEK